MMFHPKHVLIKDEFQKHRMDHQSNNNDNNSNNNKKKNNNNNFGPQAKIMAKIRFEKYKM